MNYFSIDNQVFYYQEPDRSDAVLMLTVHPTPSDITVAEQAKILAQILNKLPIVR